MNATPRNQSAMGESVNPEVVQESELAGKDGVEATVKGTEEEDDDEKSYSWHSIDDEEEDDVTDEEFNGILTPVMVARGLEHLARTAIGDASSFIHLKLPSKGLVDIGVLFKYDQLQLVHLANNSIVSLEPLSNMPHLLDIDVSGNLLAEVLDFKPPKNLMVANFSRNKIKRIQDLSQHHFLQTLILDGNEIRFIEGLMSCRRLVELSLANNKLTTIENLDHLPIHRLNLRGNHIDEIENLETLVALREIDLSHNQIRSLDGLQNHDLLQTINLEQNNVADMNEIHHISSLPNLRVLNLQDNPVQRLMDYRMEVLYLIQRLTHLDKQRASTQEKVAAFNLFKPPPEVIAAQDHARNLMYQFMQPSKVLESTLPSLETPFPMLVLVGPNGSGSFQMARRLAKDFGEYFRYAPPQSTAPPQMYENNLGDDHLGYRNDAEFDADVKGGKFLMTYSVHNNLFGLLSSSLEECAVEGLACVTVMELEGVLSLKNSHHRPRYVLLLPLDPLEHARRLRERGCITQEQIEFEQERVGLYARYNRERPGFFDRVLDTTNVREAYKELGITVMEYLGIGSAREEREELEEDEIFREEVAKASRKSRGVNLLGSALSDRPDGEFTMTSSYRDAAALYTPLDGVEAASFWRRTASAKEVVAGKLGSPHQHRFKVPATAPSRRGGSDDSSSMSGESGGNTEHSTAPRYFSTQDNSVDAGGKNRLEAITGIELETSNVNRVQSSSVSALPPIMKSWVRQGPATPSDTPRLNLQGSSLSRSIPPGETKNERGSSRFRHKAGASNVYKSAPTARLAPSSLPSIVRQ